MNDRKLATRYARALLSAIPEPAARVRVDEFLDAVGKTFAASRPIREAFEDPATSRSVRVETLQQLARGQGMPETVASFLETVVEHGRIPQLPVIATVFRELHEQDRGVVAATITTAKPMNAELEDRARRALEALTGKKVRLTTQVDGDLIGGAVTRVGSKVYDGSLRSQLESLRRRMAQE